ncbi:MAG: 2'-5' RNA ligase family protein [Kaiparowitsia implicata GSE-PSE-MK54-09C]|jgi:2'-5' RNA ligase|nr:2'-5' RNA ligase family protein [Kaiparowitsia implicata GSE-PSE-MK54-09C]
MPRFFIAIIPPLPIVRDANGVIQALSDRHHTRTANAPPHITLQPPFEWPMKQLPQLEATFTRFATAQPAVPIMLAGFGAFAPRVLYIHVVRSPALLQLQATLMQQLETALGIVDATSKTRPFVPHITVASRGMTPAVFQRAWADLEARSVDMDFLGDRLTLLIHSGQQWAIQADYPLQPEP